MNNEVLIIHGVLLWKSDFCSMLQKKHTEPRQNKGAILLLPGIQLSGCNIDIAKNIALKSGKDTTRVKEILRGDHNSTIKTLDDVANAMGRRCFIAMIPNSEKIDRTLDLFAQKGKFARVIELVHRTEYVREILQELFNVGVDSENFFSMLTDIQIYATHVYGNREKREELIEVLQELFERVKDLAHR